MLKRAGISDDFASHAARSAATSKAHSLGMSLSEIYRTAGWSSSSVFAKYYNKPIKENLGAVFVEHSHTVLTSNNYHDVIKLPLSKPVLLQS